VIEYRPLSDKIDELRGGRSIGSVAPAVDPDLQSFLLSDGEDEEDALRKKAAADKAAADKEQPGQKRP